MQQERSLSLVARYTTWQNSVIIRPVFAIFSTLSSNCANQQDQILLMQMQQSYSNEDMRRVRCFEWHSRMRGKSHWLFTIVSALSFLDIYQGCAREACQVSPLTISRVRHWIYCLVSAHRVHRVIENAHFHVVTKSYDLPCTIQY